MNALEEIHSLVSSEADKHQAEIIYEAFKSTNQCPNCQYQILHNYFQFQLSKYTYAKKRMTFLRRRTEHSYDYHTACGNSIRSCLASEMQLHLATISNWKYSKIANESFRPCPDCKKKYNPTNSSKITRSIKVENFQLIQKGICDE